jgi:predicted ester cyclase
VSIEQDKANMSRLMVDLFSNGDFSVVDELVAPDFVEHSAAPGLPPGIPGLKAIAQHLRAGFPDFQVAVEDAIAEEDRVVLRLTAGGTQRGQVFDIPPTGKQAQWAEIHIMRVKDGRMVEHWDLLDLISMRQQLGAMGH